MFQISHVEFILLALICEQDAISGYQLNRFIDERGYREWTDIGTTSIYLGLKKLKQKNYITSRLDRYKTGKGPRGTQHTLTPAGVERLKSETYQGLTSSRERGGVFMLAVSAINVLSTSETLEALGKRVQYLRRELERVREIYKKQQPNLDLPADLLFQYSFSGLNKEISITEEMIVQIQEHDIVNKEIKEL